MSNQILNWSTIVLPWILLLIFRKQLNLKWFMAAALLSTLISIIVAEMGITLNWWVVKETAYPLRTIAFVFGLNPLITILILRLFYGRFWVYFGADILINLGFAYIFLAFLGMRNIFEYAVLGPLAVTCIATAIGVLVYWYQTWQETVLARD